MATRFYRARSSDGRYTMAYDSDSPLPLFEHLASEDRLTDDWVIDLLDYKGDTLQADVPLAQIRLDITADRLFALIARA